jgi:hypothetical protein
VSPRTFHTALVHSFIFTQTQIGGRTGFKWLRTGLIGGLLSP